MGRRAKLFQSAKDCVNVLVCPIPDDSLYEIDFILNLIFCTRWKLIKLAQSLLQDLYKYDTHSRCDLRRFYKTCNIHMYQLRKYNCNKTMNERNCDTFKCMEDSILYLRKISYMVTTMCKHSK